MRMRGRDWPLLSGILIKPHYSGSNNFSIYLPWSRRARGKRGALKIMNSGEAGEKKEMMAIERFSGDWVYICWTSLCFNKVVLVYG